MTMTFKSCLAEQLQAFIHYRDALGYAQTTTLKSHLKTLDRYLPKTWDHKEFPASFFLEFKKKLTGSPRSKNNTLSCAKRFFDYMVRIDQASCNPFLAIPPEKEHAFIPFIFSQKETDALLCAVIRQIRPDETHFLKDMMIYIAMVLLARCGMRISEPFRLNLTHYRPDDLTLYIEKTKFSKDRLIAVPKTVATELNHYLALRQAFIEDGNPYFFPGKSGKSISKGQIYPVFHHAVKSLGLEESLRLLGTMRFGGPCPHSLRHSFAVNTLKRIKEQGRSAQQALPVLSVYMGHCKYRYTAVYLKLRDASHRHHLVNFSLSNQDEL